MRQWFRPGALLVILLALGACSSAMLAQSSSGPSTIEEIRRAVENAESAGEEPTAEEPAVDESPADPGPENSSFLVLEGEVPQGAWIELMPLAPTGRAWLWRRDGDDVAPVLPESLPAGPAMVCGGASRPPGVTFGRSEVPASEQGTGVHCRRVYLVRESATGVVAEVVGEVVGEAAAEGLAATEQQSDDLAIAVDFAPGLAIEGRYSMDGLAVEGARVSLAPDRLEASRAFTLPLAVEADAVVREVITDEQGRFRLPPVRPGRYRLETVLPTGRVHRPPAFELPPVADVAAEAGPLADGQRMIWDLGEIEVEDWLAVEISVIDELGELIAGAEVSARQGRRARDLVAFRGTADERGWVRLSGFDPEQPIRLDCRAPGHTAWGADFELLPVEVVCRLERLARIEGQLLTSGGEPAAGGTISTHREDVADSPASDSSGGLAPGPARVRSGLGADGAFSLELAPGRQTLTAAAPGFMVDRRVVDLAAGERLELGSITLLPGREISGLVLEAEAPTQGPPPLVQEQILPEPVPFAEVRAIEPPGAAAATADVDGVFELTSIGEQALLLEVSAEGFAAERIELAPAEQRRQEPLVIELHRGGWIRALVFEAGEPCGGCRLRLLPGHVELVTDVSGQAVTQALKPGLYRVEKPRVLHLGSQWIEVESAVSRRTRVVADEISTVRFELEPERWAVRFEPSLEAGSGNEHDWRLIARTEVGEERIERGADGLFHVPRPEIQPQQIFLNRFDERTGYETEVRVAVLDPSLQVTPGSQVTAGEPIVLPLPSGAVHGRVRGYAPVRGTLQPLPGVRVRLQTVADGVHIAELRTDGDGRFELAHLPPGVYSLLLGERAFQFISVGRGTRLDLGEFQLVDGGY